MTIAEFKTYFPEFDTATDAQIQRALDISLATTSEAILGSNYELGLKYLTAHFLTISVKQFSGNSGNTQNISSKSVDGVSLSYQDGQPNDSLYGSLNSTSYGQMFNRLTFGYGSGGFAC